MRDVGLRLATRWLVVALLLVFGPRAAWAACGHDVTGRAGASSPGDAGLDLLESAGALPQPSGPGLPHSPCHGIRCSQGTSPPVTLPRLVRHTDLLGCFELCTLVAPHASAPVAFEDDAPPPSDRADRLDRPPR